jgi:predicted RND superfamily exporter protein
LVTGVPITHFESLGEMHRAFVTMSLLAIVAIVILLALDFRNMRDVALALAPLGVGMIWTIGIMRVLGVSFNLANFFAVPMLIGLGVDSAVHILHRFHEGADGADRLHFGRTRRAVILTALTTIIGFGALIIAHHRGLRSLGLVMAIGSTACMLSSIVILPALLALRGGRAEAMMVLTPRFGRHCRARRVWSETCFEELRSVPSRSMATRRMGGPLPGGCPGVEAQELEGSGVLTGWNPMRGGLMM